MSAWPEAIYIINKLNQALENLTTFERDVESINDVNRKITNLNTKIINSGTSEETIEEFMEAMHTDEYVRIDVKAATSNVDKVILYSEMAQQGDSDIVTSTVLVPSLLFDTNSNLKSQYDFSYTIPSTADEATVLYIYTDFTSNHIWATTPPSLEENTNYDLLSLIYYLDAQDTYLDTLVDNMNNRLNAFLTDNALLSLTELVTSINSKMVIISETAPEATLTMPLTDYTVWLKKG